MEIKNRLSKGGVSTSIHKRSLFAKIVPTNTTLFAGILSNKTLPPEILSQRLTQYMLVLYLQTKHYSQVLYIQLNKIFFYGRLFQIVESKNIFVHVISIGFLDKLKKEIKSNKWRYTANVLHIACLSLFANFSCRWSQKDSKLVKLLNFRMHLITSLMKAGWENWITVAKYCFQ